MKTIIMAGGKGTRLSSIAQDIPKPMVRLFDKPILEYQLDCLKKNGLKEIVIVIGHLGKAISEYFGDGKKFGCAITYYDETEPLGTAGALYKIYDELSDNFILLNGDTILDMDFSRMICFHKEKKALATLAVHPNSHPFDSALLITNSDNQITDWLNKEDPRLYYKNQVNAGVHILAKELLSITTPQKEKVDLDRDILKPSVNTGRLFAYHTPEYIKDMGTPERYAQVSSDIKSGMVQEKNLAKKQKAVFLDRDGTINIFNDFITRPEDFELIGSAAEAIKKINSLGYLAIVITNQPIIARGEVDFETLDCIHNKMETELGKHGAYIDDLFYCPHHPDKGFLGERPEYKIDCDCRKPKPGMILQAAEKYNIDLSKSYMVGDDKRDTQAGISAGCIPIYLTNGKPLEDNTIDNNIKAYNNLKDFTEQLL